MSKRAKKQELYLEEVLRLHREKGYGEHRIARILPIGHTTVSRWLRSFASETESSKVKMPTSQLTKKTSSDVTDVQVLRAEIARLQSQLDRASLRADAYEKMIEVAESKFNIPIRKKAGAKR